jgi:hypothetical protein
MTIQTRQQSNRENEIHTCQFCGGLARYWSQNELPNGKAGGPVVYHCQNHREEGRKSAECTERKIYVLVNRFLIEWANGSQENIPFEVCTPEKEAALRAEAAAQRQPNRNVKRTKRNSRRNSAGNFMHKGYSPADAIVAGDIVGINVNKVR